MFDPLRPQVTPPMMSHPTANRLFPQITPRLFAFNPLVNVGLAFPIVVDTKTLDTVRNAHRLRAGVRLRKQTRDRIGHSGYPMSSGGSFGSMIECEPIGPATTILIQPSAALKSASPRIHGERGYCAGCSGMTNDPPMTHQ